MALIECNECGNQISDTAAACPKCGAAVPVTIGPDDTQCGHCMTVVSNSAVKCPGCGAVKGYLFDRRYGALGKFWSVTGGIVIPLLITIPFPIIGLVMIPMALYSAYRVFITGERWFA